MALHEEWQLIVHTAAHVDGLNHNRFIELSYAFVFHMPDLKDLIPQVPVFMTYLAQVRPSSPARAKCLVGLLWVERVTALVSSLGVGFVVHK